MYVDPSGNFPILLTMIIIGAMMGGFAGGYTASQNGSNIVTGVLTDALLGGTVGAVIGLNGVYLASGVLSRISKGIADLVSVAYFGGETESLQSYALAFSLGG